MRCIEKPRSLKEKICYGILELNKEDTSQFLASGVDITEMNTILACASAKAYSVELINDKRSEFRDSRNRTFFTND